MSEGQIEQFTVNTSSSGHQRGRAHLVTLLDDVRRRRAFDHLKLAVVLREVMRFRRIGHSLAEKDDLTWRRVLMGHRQKDYFNRQAVVGLAKLDDGPELLRFFSGLLPLSREPEGAGKLERARREPSEDQ